MSWLNNRDGRDAHPKLKGKTEEEVVAALELAEKEKTEREKLERDREEERAQFGTLTNQFNEIKGKLASLEANASKPPIVQNNDEPSNFIDDPDKAFNDRARPLAQATVHVAATQARQTAQYELDNEDMAKGTHNGRLFRHWGSQITQESGAYQATALMNPLTWVNIFYKIKGLHADEMANPEAKKKNYAFLEGGVTNVTRPEEKDKKEELTPQELKVAERMGVKPEDYMKRKKAMTFVGA